MIAELFIRNFAIIEEVRIDFRTGFNVLTGETGAGKSIILDAMALVLGDRADTGVIRDGTDNAYVEALFNLKPIQQAQLSQILESEGLEGEKESQILLSRELRANGRSISRVNGRTVNLTMIRTLGDGLVDIHGQGDHLSLLRPKSHLPLLDAFASLEGERESFRESVHQIRKIRREQEALRQDEAALARRHDLLAYQIQEIGAAGLVSGEDADLEVELIQLSNVERLLLHGNEVLRLLDGMNSDSPAAIDLIGQAEQSLTQLAALDEQKRELSDKLKDLNFQLSDLASDIAGYCGRLEHSPRRLDEVEERIDLVRQLKRKYGGSIESVLVWQEKARIEIEEIDKSDERIQELLVDEEALLHKMGVKSQKLSQRRQQAAILLANEVERELNDLNMKHARFAVAFARSSNDNGVFVGDERFAFTDNGIDVLEFEVSTNPGEPLRALAKVASGGETSRLMLALKSVLARIDGTPTLIFDEIDQGIGGRVGDVVGQKIWGITKVADHQVIIVTHLPQLAGYADGHFRVSKQQAGDRTTTSVRLLNKEGQVEELAAMLGTMGEHATGGAESILQHVDEIKDID